VLLVLCAGERWPQASRAAQDRPTAGRAEMEDGLRMGQPAAEYARRRHALMEQLQGQVRGNDDRAKNLVILRGADTGDRADFEEGRFRQSNNFAYLTGVDIPGAYLVLYPDEKRDVLYLPAGQLANPVMNGELSAPEAGSETARRLGFAETAETSRLLADLFGAMSDPYRAGRWRRGGASVYVERANPPARDGSAEARFIRLLREGAPSTEFKDLGPVIGELRKVKSAAELALLQKAIDITADAHRAVAGALEPGVYEYQLEGKILGAFLDGGALRPGFASIVGSGPNACIPHYFANNRRVEDGDLVVVDIGAEYECYTADITRTSPASGHFSDRQRALYQLVLDAQSHAAERFKPGETRLVEMTGWVRDFLRKSPLRACDQSGNEHTMDHFFIHGLSHYLGMDVHDVGDTSRPMNAGEVFTIEPGLYIPSENIGIRIEDDYLVTETGLEKLTSRIPSSPDDVEAWMAEGRKGRVTGTSAQAGAAGR
jgi:Xaa-Pro aminopeptidase